MNLNVYVIRKEIGKLNRYGYKTGLTVALDANLDDYTFTTGISNGFKVNNLKLCRVLYIYCNYQLLMQVLTHYAVEYPDVGERGSLISPGYEVNLALDPYSSHNAREVDLLDFSTRKCYLEEENVLQYYGNYSVSSCLKECLTQSMLHKCSCRPFHHSGDN